MKVAVIVPDEYMGDVIGDLNSRRGQIQGMEASRRTSRSTPGSAVRDVRLRHRPALQNSGRGQYSMEPSHYIEVPKTIAKDHVQPCEKED